MDIRFTNEEIEALIFETGRALKTLTVSAVNNRSAYELRKNQELIALFNDEAETKTKRTEAQRTAIYREKFADLRVAANMSEQMLKAEKDYLSCLQSNLSALQTRVRILETEVKLSNHWIKPKPKI